MSDIERLRIVLRLNTKVRRLGYLAFLTRLLEQGSSGGPVVLKALERWAEENQSDLNSYIDSTGVIKSTIKATSAKRYLEFAAAIDLIGKIFGLWRLSKYGKVLALVSPKTRNNAFELGIEEICFFARRLLLSDADFMIPVFELVDEHQPCSLMDIQRNFQRRILERLLLIEQTTRFGQIKREVANRIQRIHRWTRPHIYAEHLVPPRLHWLLDLRLLDWTVYRRSNSFQLSHQGRVLLDAFPRNNESLRYIDREWCENSYFETFIEAYLPDHEPTSSDETARAHADRFLEESFSLFRTSGIPRITASQFLLYACIRLACQYRIPAGFRRLKDYLEEISGLEGSRYSFHWSVQDDDGYILRT